MGALTEVHLSPSTRSTERAVGDPWVGFKIGQLRVGGRVVGAVRLGSSSDGGSVGVLEFHARGPSSIMESLREGVVVEVALRVVREVQSCSEGIVKRTGERSVTYREKNRHMVYVVGNESWTSGGAPGKWDEDEIVTLESIARSDVCKMCDRHLTETREWMELRIRVQGAELEQLRRMIVRRPRSAPFSTRFFSTHMVRCLTNEEMLDAMKPDGMRILHKLIGKAGFVPYFPPIFGRAHDFCVSLVQKNDDDSDCSLPRFRTGETDEPHADSMSVCDLSDLEDWDDIETPGGDLPDLIQDAVTRSTCAAACAGKSGHFQAITDDFAELFGWWKQELQGKQLMRLLSADLWTSYQLDCIFNEVLEHGGSRCLVASLRCKTGELKVCQVQMRKVTVESAGLYSDVVLLTPTEIDSK